MGRNPLDWIGFCTCGDVLANDDDDNDDDDDDDDSGFGVSVGIAGVGAVPTLLFSGDACSMGVILFSTLLILWKYWLRNGIDVDGRSALKPAIQHIIDTMLRSIFKGGSQNGETTRMMQYTDEKRHRKVLNHFQIRGFRPTQIKAV